MRVAPLAFACLIVSSALILPSLAAQSDVHAALIAPTDRKAAPAFHLFDESGHVREVADYRGKVLLLNFWATS